MATAIDPQAHVTVPDENTLKKHKETAETFFERFTPENSPEPPEIVVEKENGIQMTSRRMNLIDQIKTDASAEPPNPFKVLGAKSTEHIRSRLPKLKEVLQEEIGKGTTGAQDALNHVNTAEQDVQRLIEFCQYHIKDILGKQGRSPLDILGGADNTEAAGNFEKLKSYVNPSYMKEQGAEDAMKVLEKALDDLKGEEMEIDDKTDSTDRPIPDATTKSLYESATPYIRALLDQPESRNEEAKTKLDEINENIKHHNATSMSESDAELLMIDDVEFNRWSLDTVEKRKDLQEEPSNVYLRRKLDKVNDELLRFIKERHYPDTWIFRLPSAGDNFDAMLASIQTSTEMEVAFDPGATPDGGKIHRYNQYFGTRYNFLVQMEGRFYIKTGKDIGSAATNAYINNTNKMKMGTYYGEQQYGIKYTKTYFKKLQELDKSDGRTRHLYFLGSARRAPMTKSGRTMPLEFCIIGIRDPELNQNWYDVFKRSDLVKFCGDDMNRRITQYWEDLGEEPSRRKDLKDDAATPTTASSGGRTTRSSNPSNEATKSLRDDIEKLRSDVSRIMPVADAVTQLQEHMKQMTEKMLQLTQSIEEMKEL